MLDELTWQRIQAKLASLIGFWFVDSTSADSNDFIKGHPAKPGEQPSKLHARRMWPFGIRGRPPAGTPSITVGPLGSDSQKVMIAADSASYGPSDLADGEVAIYNSVDGASDGMGGKLICRIKFDAAGNITIQGSKPGANVIVIPSATGQVQLGDGTPANLDFVVLFAQLKGEFDAFVAAYNGHVHTGVTAGMVSTGTTPSAASVLSGGVHSSNVVAKK